MRRKLLAFVGILVGSTSLLAVAPVTPAHAENVVFGPVVDLVEVCVTLQPRSLDITINGRPVIGHVIPGVPQQCVIV